MQTSDVQWSQAEKTIARAAFDTAHTREIQALIHEVQKSASMVTEVDQVWQLHDFLSTKRHDIDGKYDYRYSNLIFVFARLINEGWLQLDELEGLQADKFKKVAVLTQMY